MMDLRSRVAPQGSTEEGGGGLVLQNKQMLPRILGSSARESNNTTQGR